jgi:protein-disulfide isomerase
VNGRPLLGAESIERFEAAVGDALARARSVLASGAPRARIYDAVTVEGAEQAVWIERERGRAHVEVADHAPRRGAASPRLTIQVWSDFECPFCGDVAPTLARLVDTNPGVRLVFRHLPLPRHTRARPAALAAIEVHRQLGDEAFWRFHDRLFEHQDELSNAELVEHARTVGADAALVAAAIESGRGEPIIEADIDAIVDTGERLGTPAILVGERLLFGALPFEEFQRAVAEEIERGEGEAH